MKNTSSSSQRQPKIGDVGQADSRGDLDFWNIANITFLGLEMVA